MNCSVSPPKDWLNFMIRSATSTDRDILAQPLGFTGWRPKGKKNETKDNYDTFQFYYGQSKQKESVCLSSKGYCMGVEDDRTTMGSEWVWIKQKTKKQL